MFNGIYGAYILFAIALLVKSMKYEDHISATLTFKNSNKTSKNQFIHCVSILLDYSRARLFYDCTGSL